MTEHVLVLVDDSDDHRFITVTELKRIKAPQPFRIQELSRGEDALAAIDRLLKDDADVLLLADYRMPRMTGLDLVRLVRKRQSTKRLRLVVYSSTDQGLAEEAQRAGADEFMVKPMELQQFRAALKRLVEDWFTAQPGPAKSPRRSI